jgi:hypothetical protein
MCSSSPPPPIVRWSYPSRSWRRRRAHSRPDPQRAL